MSKTFRKFINNKKPRNSYDDYNDGYNSPRSNYTKKRVERNINNAIRSKNVSKLVDLNDDDLDDDYVR